MLVLTRKTGEQLIIGDNIKITVVNLGPGRVKLGIEAPNWVKIDRQEIHDRKINSSPAISDAEHTDTPVTVVNLGEIAQSVKPSVSNGNTAQREPTEGPDRLENRIRRLRRYPNKPR